MKRGKSQIVSAPSSSSTPLYRVRVACEALKDELKESPRAPHNKNRPTVIATSTSKVIEIVSLITAKTSIAMKRVSCKGKIQTTVDLAKTVKKVIAWIVCTLANRTDNSNLDRQLQRLAVALTITFTT